MVTAMPFSLSVTCEYFCRFLHEPESMEMRFYQWRVEELSNEFQGDSESTDEFGNPRRMKRKRRSRWGEEAPPPAAPPLPPGMGLLAMQQQNVGGIPMSITPMVAMNEDYARRVTGGENLTMDQKKQIQEQQKINGMFDYLNAKRKAMEAQARLLDAGVDIRPKYEYDSDEDTDGGTWEHKKRQFEMEATRGERSCLLGAIRSHVV